MTSPTLTPVADPSPTFLDRRSMKAWVLERTGPPRDVLEMVELSVPEPGSGQLLVEVEVAGINFPDLLLVRGEYQISLPLPAIPGAELIGRVVRAGPDTTTPVGTRLMATTRGADGAYAELTPVRESDSEPVGDDVLAEQAIALPTNYVTAHLALHRRAHMQAGDVVVVHGGAGGVGSAAIELAKVAGGRVVGVDVGPQRARACEAAGADVGIDVTATEIGKAVHDFSQGHGADVVIDTVGGDLFDAARRYIAFEGRLVVVGFVGGTIPQLRVNQLILRSFTVMGVNAMIALFEHTEVHRAARRAVVELLQRDIISPRVGAAHRFEELPDVLVALGEKRIEGKAVIQVNSGAGLTVGRE